MPHIELTKSAITKFKYWKKFLYRSKEYKRICDMINDKKPFIPYNKLIDYWCPIVHELNSPYNDWLSKLFREPELQCIFSFNPTHYNMIKYIYPLFGDIFNIESFDPILRRINLFYELYEAFPVRDAEEKMRSFIDLAQIELEEYGVEYNAGFTFETYLLTQCSKGLFDNLICIDLNLSTDIIVKELRTYIENLREKKKERLDIQVEFGQEYKLVADHNIRKLINSISIFFPSGHNKSENFDNYIKAYDLTEKLGSADESYNKIYKETGPIDKADNPQWRKHRKHIENAKLYIRNAEFGVFPGRIHPQKQREQKHEQISRPEFQSIAHLIKLPQKRKVKGKAKRFPLESYFSDDPKQTT